MPILGNIKYPGTTHYDIPDSFLLQSDVDELVQFAKSFEFDTQINENAIEVISNSPGLNPNSFNVDGRAPLNEVTNELLRNMISSMDIFKMQAEEIQSKGYTHIYNEAGENYITVIEEYKKRLDLLKEEVEAYNNIDNSAYSYSEDDGSGNIVTKWGLRATCSLTGDLTTAPNLTFTAGTGPGGGKESVSNYEALMKQYNDCLTFFETYVTDAIELKDKCDACKDESSTYPIDEKIKELLKVETEESLSGTVTRGTPVELTGDELKEFMEFNKIHDIPGLKIYRETVNINGVDFNMYQVIDPNNYDKTMFDEYSNNSLKYLSAIDANVLAFVASNNTDLIYCTSHECDDTNYDKNGDYKGHGDTMAFARERTTNLYMFGTPEYMNEYGYEGAVHEFGHTLDYAIQDQKGRGGFFGPFIDDFYNVNFGSNENYDGEYTYNGKNFYQIADEEVSTVLDPSIGVTQGIPGNEYGTDADGAYNKDFSNYSETELIENSDSKEDKATEYFAESFRKYYSLDPEERERYRFLMPETFGYFDQLISSL